MHKAVDKNYVDQSNRNATYQTKVQTAPFLLLLTWPFLSHCSQVQIFHCHRKHKIRGLTTCKFGFQLKKLLSWVRRSLSAKCRGLLSVFFLNEMTHNSFFSNAQEMTRSSPLLFEKKKVCLSYSLPRPHPCGTVSAGSVLF